MATTKAQLNEGLKFSEVQTAQTGMDREAIAAKPQTYTPAKPVVFQPGQTTGAVNLNLPQPKIDGSQANATIAGANATAGNLQSYLDKLEAPKSEVDNQNLALTNRLNELYGMNTGRADATAKAEKSVGLDALNKSYADLNSQILTRSAEYDKLATDISGKPIPMEFITGQQAQVRLQKASEIGLLQARALGVQGQVSQAKDAVDRAVDLKYQSIEEEITAKEKQLKLIEPLLNERQQKVAAAQQLMLQDERDRIADEKEKAKFNLTLAVEQGVNTKFANKNGEFFDVNSGVGFPTAEAFFKAAGVSSFEEAYSRGLVSDVSYMTEDAGFTLSAGQTRFDANGNVIAATDAKSPTYSETTYDTDENGTVFKITTKNGVVTSRTEQKTSDKVPQEVIDNGGSNLQAVAGPTDGYVSPEDYNAGLQQWIDAGYSAKTYYDNYKKFVNPADPQDYNYYPKASGATSTQNNSGNQVKGWTGQAAKLPLLDQNGKDVPLYKAYPENSDGGQCGVFVRNLTNKQGLTYPPVGDTLASKTATVQRYGSKTGDIGSVLITSENKQSGHVAYIIGRTAKGWILAESNYGLNEKVNYGRVIPFNSPSIIGYIKPH